MKKSLFILFMMVLLAFKTKAQDVGGIWLSAPGMIGEGTGIHNGEMQVLSIDDSVENLSAGSSGAATGKILFGSFSFKKGVSSNSVFLFSSVGKGLVLPDLIFKFYDRKLNGTFTPCLIITLFNVTVVKYKISATETANSLQTTEVISLFYNKIQVADSTNNSAVIQNNVRL